MASAVHLVGSYFDAYAFEQITDLSSSVGLTEANYSPTSRAQAGRAQRVLITNGGVVGTDFFRYRLDGTAPTSSVGHTLLAGDSLLLESYDNIEDFRAIDGAATTGSTIEATYFR